MNILNIMLGKGHGGLEQVAIDYHRAFTASGHTVTSVMPPDSWAKTVVLEFTDALIDFENLGEWDPIAPLRLSKIIKRLQPDVIICHGNRATRIALKSSRGLTPLITVAHNYKNKKFNKCNAVFCITKQLVDKMIQSGIPREHVFHVPNMITNVERPQRSPFRTPPIIGALGRFVDKKGFSTYIEALGILKSEAIEFKAVLGGDGPLKEKLEEQISKANLCSEITLTGWVTDKDVFFKAIDIFILPSSHEPFGIVLIEAMFRGIPCIATNSEGPSEIITDNRDGILVPIHDSKTLASSIKSVITQHGVDPKQLGIAGQKTVRDKYTLEVVSKTLDQSVKSVSRNF